MTIQSAAKMFLSSIFCARLKERKGDGNEEGYV